MREVKRSIRKKVERPIRVLMITAIVILGTLGVLLTFLSTRKTLERNLPVLADFASQALAKEVASMMNVVEVSGTIARLSNEENSWESKKEILDGHQKKYSWVKYILADAQGNDVSPGNAKVDPELHKKAMEGELAIGEPVWDEEFGGFTITVCVPLWQGGLRNTVVVGSVTAVIDGEELCDIMSDLSVGEGGFAYLLDEEGNMIAHTDRTLVLSAQNLIEKAQLSGNWNKQAGHEKNMIEQKSGFGQYYNEETGESRLMAYVPVGINSWSVAISVPYIDYIDEILLSMILTTILTIIMLTLAIMTGKKVGNRITHPIETCAQRLQLLAEGDLKTEVPEIQTDDETLWLAESTKLIVGQMNKIIGDVDYLLEELAGGNFGVRTKIGDEAYQGDFKQILLSMRALKMRLKDTLIEIHEGSRQVEAGAVQMAESSQSLAEGATDQAESVEELLANITDVAVHIDNSNKATDKVYTQASKVVEEARIGQRKMGELSIAMDKIEEASRQIGNIIQNIEEIASETNLLSLNAAIEAARAGEAGRGFSVVADQIRKLAEQSAESAVDTRQLIETSIEVVNSGGEITKDTASYLNKVIEGIQEIMDAMETVREASNKQSMAINDIEQSAQQISQVVESNSASAEEGSATSEELSAQAETLGTLISKFKLEEQR